MSVPKTTYTNKQFQAFVQQSENIGKVFEHINGEIVEVNPSGTFYSILAIRFASRIQIFVDDHDLGFVSGPDGGYSMTNDDTFAPDVAFVSKKQDVTTPQDGYFKVIPDLIIEVVSPSDLEHPERIQTKLAKYLELEIPLLWYAYAHRKEIEVYRPNQEMLVVSIDGVLQGYEVLPNFTLKVRDIFRE